MNPPEPRKEQLPAAPVGTEVLGRDATEINRNLPYPVSWTRTKPSLRGCRRRTNEGSKREENNKKGRNRTPEMDGNAL